MNTKLSKIEDTKQIKDEELAEAAQILRDGGLVAFPTETVYGLGASLVDLLCCQLCAVCDCVTISCACTG